jgi:hypothetical protein
MRTRGARRQPCWPRRRLAPPCAGSSTPSRRRARTRRSSSPSPARQPPSSSSERRRTRRRPGRLRTGGPAQAPAVGDSPGRTQGLPQDRAPGKPRTEGTFPVQQQLSAEVPKKPTHLASNSVYCNTASRTLRFGP